MIINHLAGIMLLKTCKGCGILEIGKINPDKSITGSIKPINEIIMAVCCVSETVEIRMPNDKEVMINKILSAASKNKLPLTGILKIKILNTMITMALMMDKKM